MTEEKKAQIYTELNLCIQVLKEISKELSEENGHDMAVTVTGSTYYNQVSKGMKTYGTVDITDVTDGKCKTGYKAEGALDGIL